MQFIAGWLGFDVLAVTLSEFIVETTRREGGGEFWPAQDGAVFVGLLLIPALLCPLSSSAIPKHWEFGYININQRYKQIQCFKCMLS